MKEAAAPEETGPPTESRAPDDATPARGAPDGDPRWRVTLTVMWVAQLSCIMGFSFVMPFIPFLVRELGVEERVVPLWAGLTGMAAGLTMSTMGPIWGWVADRYGRKPMVVRAMFGGSFILGLMGLSRSIYDLLVLRALQGSVTGTVPASTALVSTVVPKARLGFSLGLMQMAVFTGGSIGPLLGGIAADRYGYRVPFGITAALLFIGGVLVAFGARERFVRPSPESRGTSAPLRVLLRNRGIIALLGVYLLMSLSGSFAMPIFPLLVEEVVGTQQQAASETGLLLGVTGIAAAVAAVMVGRLGDRYGHKAMLVTCTALAGVLCLPHYFAQSMPQFLALRLLFGLGIGGMMPAMNAMVASIIPRDNIGQAYGFTTTASALGWAFGPALGGWTASHMGYRIPFVVMGAALLLVAVAQHRGLRAADNG